MNTHYIPRLLLRYFATREHINTYNFTTKSFEQKKLKNTFSEIDLFDEKLERLFASKLEGPFGNLLNHKLLNGEVISLNRQENLLLRKFLMINFLRAPIVNTTWNEMVERTKLQEHQSVQAMEFLIRNYPEFQREFHREMPSMDNVSVFHKTMVINERRYQLKAERIPYYLHFELQRLQLGNVLFSGNYSVYPISPTICIVCFSPYFRAFFNIVDGEDKKILYPPLLKKEVFYRHFYKKLRLELFEPCNVTQNKSYTYKVKQLTKEELYHIISLMLDMETEEFAFKDKSKIE